MTLIAGIAMVFTPLLKITWTFINGGVIKSKDWVIPFKVEFFCDLKISPAYELIYLLSIFSTFAVAVFLSAVDTLMLGVSFHIVANLKNLEAFIRDVDDEMLRLSDGVSLFDENANLNKVNQKTVEEKLIGCINYHNEIYKYIAREEKYGPLYFIQYIGSIFTLCCSAFQASILLVSFYTYFKSFFDIFFLIQKLDNFELAKHVIYITANIIQLFVYAYAGSTVAEEGCKVSDVIYKSEWFRRPTNIRYYYRVMILRAQKPKYIKYFFNCSLQSFTMVLSNAASFFTLLQSIQNK